jgi:sulfite reductase alpha subunit-like flavoprotein
LHQVIQVAASKSPEQAAEYVKALSASKRYRRDVY